MVNLEKRQKIKRILVLAFGFIIVAKFANIQNWFKSNTETPKNKIVYDSNNLITEIHVNNKVHILNKDGTIKEIKAMV